MKVCGHTVGSLSRVVCPPVARWLDQEKASVCVCVCMCVHACVRVRACVCVSRKAPGSRLPAQQLSWQLRPCCLLLLQPVTWFLLSGKVCGPLCSPVFAEGSHAPAVSQAVASCSNVARAKGVVKPALQGYRAWHRRPLHPRPSQGRRGLQL